MDSCHIFNFLFGTKKATTELSRCFSSVVVRGGKSEVVVGQVDENGAPQSRLEKRASDNKSAKSKKTSVANTSQSHQQEPGSNHNNAQAPLSPLRQLQMKIVQTFAPLANSTSSPAATKTAAEAGKPTAQQQHETSVSCDLKSGTYRATLVQSVDEPDADCEEPRFEVIEIVENPANKLDQAVPAQGAGLCNEVPQASGDQQQSASGYEEKLEEVCNEQAPAAAARFKRVVLYDEHDDHDDDDDEEEDGHQWSGQLKAAAREQSKQPKPSILAATEVYNMVSERSQDGEMRANLRKVETTLNSAATNSTAQESRRLSEGGECREPRSWRDKRSVYVQGLVQSIELNGGFEPPPPQKRADKKQESCEGARSEKLLMKTPSAVKPTTIVKPMPPKTPPKTNKAKCLNIQLSLNKPTKIQQLFQDESFLVKLFNKLEPLDRCVAAQVCRLWRNVLYANQNYWKDLINVIDCTQLRREQLIECIVNTLQSARLKQQQHKALATNAISEQDNCLDLNNNLLKPAGKDFSYFDIDQEDVWRIQELCNRFTQRLNQQQAQSRQVNFSSNEQHTDANNNNAVCTTSKSSSIPSQISSTPSSLSISSLLSPVSESSRVESMKEKLYTSLDDRGFDAICLFGATDDDIEELIAKLPPSSHLRITKGRLSNCCATNRGLELFVSAFSRIEELELSGCNELTNAFELKQLSRLRRLIVTDCINIADGLAQNLAHIVGRLDELTIQAYHLTDAFVEYLSANADTKALRRLELPNCKEITNHTLVTVAKHFPQLEVLSISGSTKINDDGIEILADQARNLKSLDLSWCSRISDASLECIACDLGDTLLELVLDRNVHITDTGLGYLATMRKLSLLNVRWCPQVTDAGLEAILTMKTLRVLSVAGLHQLTARSLLCLIEADQLEELELTNCAAVNHDLQMFLAKKMPKCNIIF